MRFSLNTTTINPEQNNEIHNAVILFHGYGGDGKDISTLSLNWKRHLPNTIFICPNGHEKCPVNPSGFQWFPIEWLYGPEKINVELEIEKPISALREWIVSQMLEFNVTPEQTVLIGFSQGTRMTLPLATRGKDHFAGIVGFSGKLLAFVVPVRQPDLNKASLVHRNRRISC